MKRVALPATQKLVSKLGIVEQELDETLYRIELLIEAEVVNAERLAPRQTECNELLSMVIAASRTIKRDRR